MKFKKNSQKRFKRYFTQDKMAYKYFDLYKSVINVSNNSNDNNKI